MIRFIDVPKEDASKVAKRSEPVAPLDAAKAAAVPDLVTSKKAVAGAKSRGRKK